VDAGRAFVELFVVDDAGRLLGVTSVCGWLGVLTLEKFNQASFFVPTKSDKKCC
jgi:hypothetical protein